MLRRLRSLFATPDASPNLQAQARSLDPDVRHAAVSLLRKSLEPWAGALLLDLLADTHSIVRDASRDALTRMGPEGTPILLAGLKHANPDIAKTAAELLGDTPTPEVIEALLLTLKYAVRPVQLEAKRSLIRIGPVARPALEAALADGQPWVVQQLRDILATHGAT